MQYYIPELDELELIEEIREEAYRLYTVHESAGRTSSPQDEWHEAWTIVSRRRAQP